MERHFNEDDIESKNFKELIFRGTSLNFNFSNVTENDFEVIVVLKIELQNKIKEFKKAFVCGVRLQF